MAKSIASFSVDGNVKELFQKTYPRRASAMIESYMRDMLGFSSQIPEDITVEEIEKRISTAIQEEAKTRLLRQTLEQRKKEYEAELFEKNRSAITAEQEAWIKDIGVKICHNKGVRHSHRSFCEIFLRFDYPFKDYVQQIREYMKDIQVDEEIAQ